MSLPLQIAAGDNPKDNGKAKTKCGGSSLRSE